MITGGIGHVTQQNRNIRIAIEQRDRNCKIGEEVGSPVKNWRRTAGELIVAHNTTSWSYPGRSKALEQTADAPLNTTAEEPAWWRWHAWHGSDGAMQLIHLSGVGTPDKQLLGSSYFTTPQFKCCLTWHKHGKVNYGKIKWNRDKITFPHNSIFSY